MIYLFGVITFRWSVARGLWPRDGRLLLQLLNVLQRLLPLFLQGLLLRADGGPLCRPHDGGYVESQLVRGRDVGGVCVV